MTQNRCSREQAPGKRARLTGAGTEIVESIGTIVDRRNRDPQLAIVQIVGNDEIIGDGLASPDLAEGSRGKLTHRFLLIVNAAPAKSIVDPPIPEQLALGRVFIQYRTETLAFFWCSAKRRWRYRHGLGTCTMPRSTREKNARSFPGQDLPALSAKQLNHLVSGGVDVRFHGVTGTRGIAPLDREKNILVADPPWNRLGAERIEPRDIGESEA